MDESNPAAFNGPSWSPNAANVGLAKLSLPNTTDPPSASNPPSQKVWLIFGATGHMGRSVTKAALSHGDIVSAVGQLFEDTPSSMENWHDDPDRYLGLLCDVRLRETVATVIEKTMKQFGRVDIIANCAGYGVIGACEDQDEHEIRNQFETNFMGTLNLIQLSLPYFRKRRAGRYLIFSSTSGALGVPGLGPYCATKYAVEGLIESMLYEVDQFSIRVTLVEPGHLRRDDVHVMDNGQRLPMFGHFKVAKASEPYMGKDAPAAHAQRALHWIGDNQPTSVVKAAELIWQLGHCSYPPLRLLLGSFAVDSIRDRLKSIIEEIEDWKHLSFPPLEGHEETPPEDGEGDGGEEDADAEGGRDDDDDDEDEDEEENAPPEGDQGVPRESAADADDHSIKNEHRMDVDVDVDD
ncbi:oxidoreductase [Capronia epimyces CBS 606.96]|uniref:Oxidoreductase n=1 Tax=Capronia epimyces CBS 606.96 TaxID=1182542 RepID=W9YB61_9EURO|nr:oxidoreductase [Capronia epimyces CBS 606.96]EXJ79614.1 oxidoreductase [Capronia epimyces CBS 606.96]